MSEEFLHQHKIVPAPEFPAHLRQPRGMDVAKRRVKGDTGGVFPGNPEALAMQKAQAQQLSQARLGAAQQARQEQAGLAALGQQYLGAGYVPQAQMLSALAPGQTAAAAQQQAQLYGTGLFGEATASGIDALLGSALGQANLLGAAGSGLLAGLFGGR